jgi:hypothetical protein
MEGIESSGEEDKDTPAIKVKEDLLNTKKKRGKKPLLKRLAILGFLPRN